ncbi:addiction module protein [Nitrospira sp. Nam80]
MSSLSIKDILQLSVTERVQIAEEIWDSILESSESLAVTDAQKAELDRRRDAHAKNPSATRSWEEIRAELDGKE